MEVKLVSVTLPVNFLHDILVIVISQSPAHLVVVHVGLGLPLAPPAGHLVGVGHLELARGALPGDEGDGGRVRQELEEKLPKLDLSGWLDGGWARCRVTAAYFCNMMKIKSIIQCFVKVLNILSSMSNQHFKLLDDVLYYCGGYNKTSKCGEIIQVGLANDDGLTFGPL